MLRQKVSTVLFKDSKYLFDTITKLSTFAEKRLLIDIAAIRENYSNSDLSNVAHVASIYILANLFAKQSADSAMLRDVMAKGRLVHPVNRWILPQ